MYSRVYGADISGTKARIICIEADVCEGLPVFDMVGYLASAVREARERVRIALRNVGVRFPAKRITVNLSPAHLKKEGTSFDLPIAISLLTAFGHLSAECVEDCMFVGEVGLDGRICPVRGVLAMVLEGREKGIKRFLVPTENAGETVFLEDVFVIGVSTMQEVLSYLRGDIQKEPAGKMKSQKTESEYEMDFLDICGHTEMKRAAEIAVSGCHNLLLLGPAGSGKSMLAKRMPTIMPSLTREESLEVTKLYSIMGELSAEDPIVRKRPFRAPHHTITPTTLTGGGRIPVPGELTLAEKGVLFLDELPEFKRPVLEVLRQPLEERKITLSRVGHSFEYPCNCQFVAAMNPCRCGFFPDRDRCRCTEGEIRQYLSKISEPILDRMDICVETGMPEFCLYEEKGESSKTIRKRVERTWEIQKRRYEEESFCYNSRLPQAKLERYCHLTKEQKELMREFFRGEEYSMRKVSGIIKVARTIADMEEEERISDEHLLEAVRLRSINKKYWR